jgi:hypothetical protein
MKLICKYVEASEAGDYFQVLFKTENDEEAEYFLIQNQFEFSTKHDCYIETKGNNYIGHFKIEHAILTLNSFSLKIIRRERSEINIFFKIPKIKYIEIKRVLKIIIPKLTVNENESN